MVKGNAATTGSRVGREMGIVQAVAPGAVENCQPRALGVNLPKETIKGDLCHRAEEEPPKNRM